ncbi:hypothetical protein FQR65_LT11047 [Abscondita terminalis]|nr:hypothetical protein FQR65_LT11047 [Abscondita terminalis]
MATVTGQGELSMDKLMKTLDLQRTSFTKLYKKALKLFPLEQHDIAEIQGYLKLLEEKMMIMSELDKKLFEIMLNMEEIDNFNIDEEMDLVILGPLTYLFEDISDLVPLTPAMFLQEVTQVGTTIVTSSSCKKTLKKKARGWYTYVHNSDGLLKNTDELTHVPTFGNDDIDAATQRLLDELRKMFVPLMKMILNETHIDINAFKANLIERFFVINEVFESLVKLIDADTCPPTPKDFVTKIIYFYYYTIKQTHFEIRTAYKNSFYGHEPGDTDLLTDSDKFEIESPEELVMNIQKLVQSFNAKNWDAKPIAEYAREFVQVLEYIADKISKEVRIRRLAYTEGIMMKFYEDLKNTKKTLEETVATKEIFVRSVQKIFVELYKIVIVEKMQDDGYEHLLLKDVCIEFYNYLKNVFHQAEIYDEIVKSEGDSSRYERQVVRRPKFVFIKVIKYE